MQFTVQFSSVHSSGKLGRDHVKTEPEIITAVDNIVGPRALGHLLQLEQAALIELNI